MIVATFHGVRASLVFAAHDKTRRCVGVKLVANPVAHVEQQAAQAHGDDHSVRQEHRGRVRIERRHHGPQGLKHHRRASGRNFEA